MQIIRKLDNIPQNLQHAVIAIGNFDGVHLAHQYLLQEAINLANKQHKPKLVMSFYPHPKYYFVKNAVNFAIEPFSKRLHRLREMGFDGAVTMRFSKTLADMSAHDFINDILKKQLKTSDIIIGEDFRFGKDRKGTASMLCQYGINCLTIPQINIDNEVISSSNVRQHLSAGEMQKASKLLGRAYEINGVVCHGDKRGREIGYRTINIRLNKLHLPAFGVYVVQLLLNGIVHNAIANIGVRPTFGNNQPILEVHSFKDLPDIYGHKIIVQLLHYIRAEHKFESANALQQQIRRDINIAEKYFENL